jgi:hypothetical protein
MTANCVIHDASMYTSLSGTSLSKIMRIPFSHYDLSLDSPPQVGVAQHLPAPELTSSPPP